ncbi:MAG: ATP-grasp domain-containing protein, partial [Planctomycetes bacterium]|nr:ATP-grasp domain-containing protein [Planctomycetota bacterium]
RDPRVLQFSLPGCEIVDIISSAAHHDEFERLAAIADATIVIAPEFDGILLKAARNAVAAGGTLFSPSPEFIGIAANKQQTCETLEVAGVPTPRGIVLESDEPLPSDFAYPAVIKPVDGAGSQDIYLLNGPHAVPAYAWPRRLEQYVPGMAASVAVLCNSTCRVVLPACRQRISDDGRLRYLGGSLPLATGLAERAATLAIRTLAALPPATGYIGIDLVLGRDPHGGEDAVIEVNPRLTTSYVGLRAALAENLAEIMCQVVRGAEQGVSFNGRPLEFDTEGNVSFVR